MTITEFISLLDILIWPFTLLAVIVLFKPYLAKAFERLGSIQAGPAGVSFTFKDALEKAKETFETNNPGALALSKSSASIAFAKAYDSPYEQLIAIKKSLDETILSLAAEKGMITEGTPKMELINELSASRAIRTATVAPLRALLIAVDSAPLSITQEQVNLLQSLHDAL